MVPIKSDNQSSTVLFFHNTKSLMKLTLYIVLVYPSLVRCQLLQIIKFFQHLFLFHTQSDDFTLKSRINLLFGFEIDHTLRSTTVKDSENRKKWHIWFMCVSSWNYAKTLASLLKHTFFVFLYIMEKIHVILEMKCTILEVKFAYINKNKSILLIYHK